MRIILPQLHRPARAAAALFGAAAAGTGFVVVLGFSGENASHELVSGRTCIP